MRCVAGLSSIAEVEEGAASVSLGVLVGGCKLDLGGEDYTLVITKWSYNKKNRGNVEKMGQRVLLPDFLSEKPVRVARNERDNGSTASSA